MAQTRAPNLVKQKVVVCCYCGRQIEVPAKALSGSCPRCHKRIILEHVKINGYMAVKRYDTCGPITVEKKGHLVAATIRGESLRVRGHLRGNVTARQRVQIDKGGILSGDVQAPVLVVQAGGLLNGYCRVGRSGGS